MLLNSYTNDLLVSFNKNYINKLEKIKLLYQNLFILLQKIQVKINIKIKLMFLT